MKAKTLLGLKMTGSTIFAIGSVLVGMTGIEHTFGAGPSLIFGLFSGIFILGVWVFVAVHIHLSQKKLFVRKHRVAPEGLGMETIEMPIKLGEDVDEGDPLEDGQVMRKGRAVDMVVEKYGQDLYRITAYSHRAYELCNGQERWTSRLVARVLVNAGIREGYYMVRAKTSKAGSI
jgi:hypothetical protein